MRLRMLALCSIASLAACGGSGGSSGPSTPATISVPPVVPATATPGTGQNSSLASVTISFLAGASGGVSAANKPQYVSPSAATFIVKINSYNGSSTLPSWLPSSQTYPLTTGAGGICRISGGVETCTISSIPAPTGTVAYTFTVNDASAVPVSTVNTTQTFASGGTGQIPVTMKGVVKSVTFTTVSLVASAPSPAPSPAAVAFQAKDNDGNVIAGEFSSPVTFTDQDTSGVTNLRLNGGTPSSSVIVSSSTDAILMNYSGQAIPATSVKASGSGGAGTISGTGTVAVSYQPITLVGANGLALPVCSASIPGCTGAINFNKPTLFFPDAGTGIMAVPYPNRPTPPPTVTASETGYTDFGKTLTSTPSGCSGIATITAAALPNAWNVAMASGASAGICSAAVADTVGQTATYYISVSTSNIFGN